MAEEIFKRTRFLSRPLVGKAPFSGEFGRVVANVTILSCHSLVMLRPNGAMLHHVKVISCVGLLRGC